ncbi:MAG: VOC family protein [Alphaproteobacteria bacterium]|nr:VOC family protein [Alphaproteobacteria bacterium]
MTYKPDSVPSVAPYIIVNDAQKVLDFVKRAFDAEEIQTLRNKNGIIQYAQIRIGDGMVMLSENKNIASPSTIYLYVADSDCHYERGLASGGTSVCEPEDRFYGDRNAAVKDPCGNVWWVATHKEALSREIMESRAHEAV